MTARPLPARAAPLLVALAACAGVKTPPPPVEPERVEFQEPQLVETTAEDLELAGKNDEELFALGSAAFAAGDYRRAANAFGRIADLFPASRHRATALFQAGLSHRALGAWQPALERLRAAARVSTGSDSDEAAFRIAEALYNLGRFPEACAELDRLAGRGDLAASERVRALDQRGIVELEMGELEVAERSLRAAVTAFAEAQERQPIDDHYAAEAQYYLGEVYRRRFEAVELDPARQDPESLGAALERKAQLLLAAQEQYLRALAMRDANAVVASGYRIGGLYDELYRQMVRAPLPVVLGAGGEAAYREELRRRVRVLVLKAIRNYEDTLQIAQRAGVAGPFVDITRASLERMKSALGDEGPAVPEAAAAPAPQP